MSDTGLTRYQREVARARAQGFASPYAMRKARDQQQGFSSPRAKRTASERKRGQARDYALEREVAERKARQQGFVSAKERTAYRKVADQVDQKLWQKQRTLAYFEISERQLKRIERENRNWANQNAMLQWTAINTYDLSRVAGHSEWSPERIGYILSFHAAIVNPKTNYDSLKDNPKYSGKNGLTGRKVMNPSQYYYLVQYSGLYQVNEFEARYGSNVIAQAKSGKVKP